MFGNKSMLGDKSLIVQIKLGNRESFHAMCSFLINGQ